MIEFDVDMAYCEEAGDLDLVVLNDESGDMDSREFVPKANAPACTSDGYHTFAELYEHRTGLLAALCNVAAGVMMTEGIEPEHMGCLIFKSWHHHDGEMYDGMTSPTSWSAESRGWAALPPTASTARGAWTGPTTTTTARSVTGRPTT